MDPRQVRQLAAGSANFGFLAAYPLLLCYGAGAEALVYRDPTGSMSAARAFGEVLAHDLVRRTNSGASGAGLYHQVRALTATGVLVPRTFAALERLRGVTQRTDHPPDGPDSALDCLRTCFTLGVWFHRATSGNRTPADFVAPNPPPAAARCPDSTAALFESMRPAIETARQEFTRRPPAPISATRRDEFVNRLRRAAREPLTGPQLRDQLDHHLTAAGWVVRPEGRATPTVGPGVAVRRIGPAAGHTDYLLYVHGRLVGLVEVETGAVGSVDSRLGRHRPRLTVGQCLTVWRPNQPLPFGYLASGGGVTFVNELDPFPRTREVVAVHRPATLARWVRAAEARPRTPTLRARLRQLPPLPADGLRRAQRAALHALERSLAEDRPRSLIQLAAGVGKTRVAVVASYRLLRHARADRVLHLVDSDNLGRQVLAEYAEYRGPDDGCGFTERYPTDLLSSATNLESTRVVISTVQRLHAALLGRHLPDTASDDEANGSHQREAPVEVPYQPELPPDTFDAIVVDDCDAAVHGRWRAVLEYFDAVVVGLTTTATRQSMGFFQQNLVAECTEEEAVADGTTLDFDTYRIRVQGGAAGGQVEAGPVVPVRERRTRAERHQDPEQDHEYVVGRLSRPALPPKLLRLVLETFRDRLHSEIFPGRTQVPKTLILARDAGHSAEVVTLVREIFAEAAHPVGGEWPAGAGRSADGAGADVAVAVTQRGRWLSGDPDGLLRAFRDDRYPRIVVTDDLTASGVDVPALECVLFLRPVHRESHLARLKGRAARTIEPAAFQTVTADAPVKDRYVVVDAVGITETALTGLAPLHRYAERQLPLPELMCRAAQLRVTPDEVATLAARLARLNQWLTGRERAELAELGGQPLTGIVRELVDAVAPEQLRTARVAGPEAVRGLMAIAVRPLAARPRLRDRILELHRTTRR